MDQASPLPSGAQTLLHAALEQIREHALVLLDAQAHVVAWLGAAPGMFGYSAEEMCGQPIDRLFTPEDRALQTPAHELHIALATGTGENDRWLMRKDGTRIWVEGATSTMLDDGGKVAGFCKIMRDRTDIKMQLDALEGRSQAAAVEVERSRLFLATLVHELRNPLGALSNGLQVMRITLGSDEKVKKALEIYERQLGTMRRLLDDVTDTVRADTGKLSIDPLPVQVNELLRMAALTCLPRALDKQQHLEVLEHPLPVMVMADAGRMQQVLVNLLDNAVKYSPPGAHIWIKATTEGDEAVIRVLDDGIGIDQEALPRLFELFTQGTAPPGQPSSGLGLGLALVRQIVELHGGSVSARSGGRDRGSEFTVRLPLHRARPTPAA